MLHQLAPLPFRSNLPSIPAQGTLEAMPRCRPRLRRYEGRSCHGGPPDIGWSNAGRIGPVIRALQRQTADGHQP
jgi:hypothetical protein